LRAKTKAYTAVTIIISVNTPRRLTLLSLRLNRHMPSIVMIVGRVLLLGLGLVGGVSACSKEGQYSGDRAYKML
jgi:hypothetical protein